MLKAGHCMHMMEGLDGLMANQPIGENQRHREFITIRVQLNQTILSLTKIRKMLFRANITRKAAVIRS